MTTVHEIHKQYNITHEDVKILLIQQYIPLTKQWKFHGYRCRLCDASLKGIASMNKHVNTCKTINTTKKQKDKEVPIQVVTKNGERYYRWGDTGKLYKERSDAEKQARAAYASGYSEPKKDMTKK